MKAVRTKRRAPSGRSLLSALLLAVLLVLLGCGPPSPSGPSAERVILIVVDTLRRDHVSVYNPRAKTPRLDALAARSQVHTHAVASFHQTSMSMGALFSGRTPSLEGPEVTAPLPWNGRTWCGLSRLARTEQDDCVPAHLDTLAEDLRRHGFWTIGVASNDFMHRPSGYEQGFEDWVEVGVPGVGQRQRRLTPAELALRNGETVNRAAFAALARREHDRFFLYVHYMDVHDWYAMGHGSYMGGVQAADRAIGALLDRLGDEGLLDSSLIVFTADHGEMTPHDATLRPSPYHSGNPSFEPVLAVPLLAAPGLPADPDALVRLQDLRGLILEQLGVPTRIDDEQRPDEQLFTERRWLTYRRWPWKSIFDRHSAEAHLFDLRRPQSETLDVATRHPEVLAAHRARIDELRGRVSTGQHAASELSPDDRARLEALGYLDE